MSVRARSIILDADEVRAVLAGRQVQVRRPVKPQPRQMEWIPNGYSEFPWVWEPSLTRGYVEADPRDFALYCPFGQPGTLLYVREAWQDYCPMWHGAWCGHGTQEGIQRDHHPVYRADERELQRRGPGEGGFPLKWRSPATMPRWASRLLLRVTAVRVERLQEISGQGHHDDVMLEGWPFAPTDATRGDESPMLSYRRTWDARHANANHKWAANPWTWVIGFERESAKETT